MKEFSYLVTPFYAMKNILVLSMDPCSDNGKSWTEESGNIVLPTQSNEQYQNNAACKWKLQVAPNKVCNHSSQGH